MIVEELVAVLGYDIKGEANLARFKQSLDAVASRISTFAIAAGTIAAGAMAALGKSVIETSAQFEGYQATLETIEGSADKARKSLDWVAKFGKTTPYEVGEVTEAFVRLKAYGLDPMDGTLSAVGDAASAMGKGLMQGVEAVADAATGEFERLKEFGIKSKQAGDNVVFTWSKNGKELTKTVKKNSTEIVQFLKDNFGDRFNGAMDRQSKTFNGMMSNLSDSWVDFKRRIGDGFFDDIKANLGQLQNYIARLDANGTLDRWAENIGDALSYGAYLVEQTVVRLGRHFDTISGMIERNKGAWDTFKWALLGLAVYLFPVTAAVIGIAAAIDDFLTYMRGGDSVIGDFVEAISGLLDGNLATVGDNMQALAVGAAALGGAAAGLTLFSSALWPVAAGLAAFAGAFYLAKQGFDYLEKLDVENKKIKAVENPQAKPGYIKGNGGVEYITGANMHDRPDELPTAGFTQEATDYKYLLQNLEGNLNKSGSQKATEAVVNDNKQDNRDQSVNVGGVNVVVNGVNGVSAAVGAAVGNAAGQGAAGGARRASWHEQGEKI
ncbi:tape measure protein [Pararhizobium sp.]|uniref:tape measure protein n=1 Tax=Pararhizobium sp. TaxID=1977563 RepID=UPI00271A6306|nr:tape measure protein [Pararhizobium sp.]MDO9417038.1 tape measure protein [Pararhizobium sp.]